MEIIDTHSSTSDTSIDIGVPGDMRWREFH